MKRTQVVTTKNNENDVRQNEAHLIRRTAIFQGRQRTDIREPITPGDIKVVVKTFLITKLTVMQ